MPEPGGPSQASFPPTPRAPLEAAHLAERPAEDADLRAPSRRSALADVQAETEELCSRLRSLEAAREPTAEAAEAELSAPRCGGLATAIANALVRTQGEVRTTEELDAASGEVARWAQTAAHARDAIRRLEVLSGQELIRSERLRGIALSQQAKCFTLEQQIERRRVQAQEMQLQLEHLEQHALHRQQETSREKSLWARRRQDLDKALEDARRSAAQEQAELSHRRKDLQAKHERAARHLRLQLERQEATVRCAPEAPVATPPPSARSSLSGASSPAQRRAPSPGSGDRVAALRAALHRQRQERERGLRQMRAEIVRLREEDTRRPEVRPPAWAMLQAGCELRAAEEAHARARAKCGEWQGELRALEAELDERPREIQRRLEAMAVHAAPAGGAGLERLLEVEAEHAEALRAAEAEGLWRSRPAAAELYEAQLLESGAAERLLGRSEEAEALEAQCGRLADGALVATPPRLRALQEAQSEAREGLEALCAEELQRLGEEAERAAAARERLWSALEAEAAQAEEARRALRKGPNPRSPRPRSVREARGRPEPKPAASPCGAGLRRASPRWVA